MLGACQSRAHTRSIAIMAPSRSRAQLPLSQDRSRRTISYPTSPTRTPSKAPHSMAAPFSSQRHTAALECSSIVVSGTNCANASACSGLTKIGSPRAVFLQQTCEIFNRRHSTPRIARQTHTCLPPFRGKFRQAGSKERCLPMAFAAATPHGRRVRYIAVLWAACSRRSRRLKLEESKQIVPR